MTTTAHRPARPYLAVNANLDLEIPAEPERKYPVDADGYERGGCDYCEHGSMRLYRGVLANHPEFRRWRKVVDHHYRPALVATTQRCPGSGEPPAYRTATP